MHVKSIQAHNVMRVKDIDFQMDGHHLFIVGGENDNGKSSSLESLRYALPNRS